MGGASAAVRAGAWPPPPPTCRPPPAPTGETPAWPPPSAATGGASGPPPFQPLPPPAPARRARTAGRSTSTPAHSSRSSRPRRSAARRGRCRRGGRRLFAFGRRDLIPPVIDPRTILIDRAMVGQGFITPEELAEIHKIGEQMDADPPGHRAGAHAKADGAVARRPRGAASGSSSRKKPRPPSGSGCTPRPSRSARRRDIIFLGRGVSKGLADRKSNEREARGGGVAGARRRPPTSRRR